MRSMTLRALAVGGIVAVASVIGLAPSAEASVPATKACVATVSTARPHQNATVTVNVSKVPAGVVVTTVAHYKTTNTTKTAKANSAGRAALPYKIGRATINYKVVVNVKAAKGTQRYACTTSFTPQR